MAEPFVGEIRMFAGNFAPRGYALCDGQLPAISQNNELFSLLGTIYGGDGRTTFGLPDLRGRIPVHRGSGPDLSERKLGGKGGTEHETISVAKLPAHNHVMRATDQPGPFGDPCDGLPAGAAENTYGAAANVRALHEDATSQVGQSQPQRHGNIQPFLCIHFIIALAGIYPSRN